jgi:hypothetical protein
VNSHVWTTLGYLMLAATLLGLTARSHSSQSRVPTFTDLVAWIARRRSAQFGMVLVWWWLGWHFVLGL